MITKELINSWITKPDTIDKIEINELVKLLNIYPYCEKLHWIYLRWLYVNNDVNFDYELISRGLYISNRRLFYNFITFEPNTECNTEIDNITEENISLIQPAAPDYFSLIENEDKNQQSLHELAAKLKAARLARAAKIDEENRAKLNSKNDEKSVKIEGNQDNSSHIHNNKKKIPHKIELDKADNIPTTKDLQHETKLTKAQEHNTYYSESNAQKLIKEKRYSEAYKILMAINLNNPKKSVYFALQLKYLETIINNNNKSI